MTMVPTMPSATPSRPPASPSTDASTRNCRRIEPGRAPSALRRPISPIRSVTDTSMMFITPIPPTSSEMMAMPASISAIVVSTLLAALSRDCWVAMLKSAEELSVMPCRFSISASVSW